MVKIDSMLRSKASEKKRNRKVRTSQLQDFSALGGTWIVNHKCMEQKQDEKHEE